MAERFHRWRFSQAASVSFKYLMIKLKILADKLLCALTTMNLVFVRNDYGGTL